MDILKNPIVLGVLAASLAYLYLWWNNDRKKELNPEESKEKINWIIPLSIGVFIWFVSNYYFNKQTVNTSRSINQSGGNNYNRQTNRLELSDKMTESFGNNYHLVGRNSIKLPQTDVFIDIAKF